MACATISPRYSGSCSQRLAKIRLGMGRSARASSADFIDLSMGEAGAKTLTYRSLYTSLIWCLYWQSPRRKHGIQQHRNGAPGEAGIPAASGVRQAGEH